MLGSGMPLLPAPYAARPLRLRAHRAYADGMVMLQYDVVRDGPSLPATSAGDPGIPSS